MQIDKPLLEKLEKLSSISIDDNKKNELLKQLSEIVSFVEVLNELDLDNEKATFTTIKGGTPMREDAVSCDKTIIESILKHAPSSNDEGFFVVPKIIE